MKTKREMSQQAQVAKLCRQYCKSIGVKCRARSDSFSMGDSVDVWIEDQPPAIREQIETEFSKYQYGHFNGMEDIYEYSNSRSDIPQTKYLSVNCDYSAELWQAAWDYLRSKYANGKDKPESYEEAKNMKWTDNSPHYMDISGEVYKILRGSDYGLDKENSDEFWSEYLKSTTKPATVHHVGNHSAHIEQHEHTKKGFTMYMVILDATVDRDEFNALRDQAKEAGGWYSRKWGNTPGGFAFKELGQAELFLNSLNQDEPTHE